MSRETSAQHGRARVRRRKISVFVYALVFVLAPLRRLTRKRRRR